MGSHSVTCHPAEVTFPRCWYVISLERVAGYNNIIIMVYFMLQPIRWINAIAYNTKYYKIVE